MRIANKRACTLREMTLDLAVSGVPVETAELADLSPKADMEITIPFPDQTTGPALTVEGRLRFVTHFGFRCSVPVRLVTRF